MSRKILLLLIIILIIMAASVYANVFLDKGNIVYWTKTIIGKNVTLTFSPT